MSGLRITSGFQIIDPRISPPLAGHQSGHQKYPDIGYPPTLRSRVTGVCDLCSFTVFSSTALFFVFSGSGEGPGGDVGHSFSVTPPLPLPPLFGRAVDTLCAILALRSFTSRVRRRSGAPAGIPEGPERVPRWVWGSILAPTWRHEPSKTSKTLSFFSPFSRSHFFASGISFYSPLSPSGPISSTHWPAFCQKGAQMDWGSARKRTLGHLRTIILGTCAHLGAPGTNKWSKGCLKRSPRYQDYQKIHLKASEIYLQSTTTSHMLLSSYLVWRNARSDLNNTLR